MSYLCGYVAKNGLGVVTDSFSFSEREKKDNVQKIFPVGNSVMVGTGESEYILYLVERLQKETGWSASPKKIAHNALKISRDVFRFKDNEAVNLYFFGGDLFKYRIYNVELNNIEDVKEVKPYCIGGAAAGFVKKALDRDENRGYSYNFYKSLDDLCDFLFDTAFEATKSVKANGHLQFAFFNSEGRKILFHPDVKISHLPKEYSNWDGELSDKKAELNEKVYNLLVSHLVARYVLRSGYNSINQQVWHGRIPIDNPEVEEIKAKFAQVKKNTKMIIDNYIESGYSFFSKAKWNILTNVAFSRFLKEPEYQMSNFKESMSKKKLLQMPMRMEQYEKY